MKLKVLGSNGTYPTPGRPASGYLVGHDGSLVWLDTGPGTLMAFLEETAPDDIDAVVISHIHPDHCADLFSLFNVFRYGTSPKAGLPVFVPNGAAEHLATFLRAGPDHDLHHIFRFRTVGPGDRAEVGSLHVEFGATSHSVPTLATRVTGGSASLTYSGDTGPAGGVGDLAAGCTLLLCEATYQGRPGEGRWPYHLAACEAGSLAAGAGVGRLLVTHLAPGLDPGRSVEEAAEEFDGPVAWAEPRMEVEV